MVIARLIDDKKKTFVYKNNMRTFNKNEDFIFEIIHDLKAPVISIDFALKNINRDEILDEIYRINKHNLNYIENLISGYSLSKGKYCPRFEIINLNSIVREEIRVLNFLTAEKNLRIILSVDKASEPYIISDKYLVRQIILNLLTNAVKYTPFGGTIKIVFEKKDGCFTICFSNPYDKNAANACSSKMGLEIVRKKLKALKGKLKTGASGGEICFSVCFECK